MILRQYQVEAKQKILAEWAGDVKRTLMVCPTGSGKTIIFASIAEELVRRGERVLILAHRKELLDQAADKLRKATGLECSVEKGEQSAVDSFFMITVGSVQTMMREHRHSEYDKNYFGAIIVDEAHHTLSDSYRRILSYFDGAKVLGVTATPDRGDMRNLGEIYESLAYEYTLPKAISEGFLCKLKALTIPLEININGVTQQAGDFKLSELSDAIMPYMDAIGREMAEHCRDRKTVVFLPLIATSQKMAEVLTKYGLDVREVNGESKDRADVLKWFTDAKKGSVVCNSMLLTEGWDEPSADCIVCLRPTKIRSLYCQIVGRGTRIHSGKENLLILDFLWHTNKHSLCRPAHLVCDNAELADKVTEILSRDENTAGADLQAVTESGQLEVIADREKRLAKTLEEQKHKKREMVDPLQFEMSIKAEDLVDYIPAFPDEMAPLTEKQKAMLRNAGIYPDEIKNTGLATKLLDRINNRKLEGLTTPKQIRFLERMGFSHVGTWKFEHAKKLIDRIAGNGWRVPYSIKKDTYNPNNTAKQ
jgi:superfamily II DNA or RNA helicase